MKCFKLNFTEHPVLSVSQNFSILRWLNLNYSLWNFSPPKMLRSVFVRTKIVRSDFCLTSTFSHTKNAYESILPPNRPKTSERESTLTWHPLEAVP